MAQEPDQSLFWEEETPEQRMHALRDVVDVSFRIECACLPLDHAEALSRAVLAHLPWLADTEYAGIHLIHGAESGNGWMRPQNPEADLLHLSRRARLRLRVPVARLPDAHRLQGARLEIAGYPLAVGAGNPLPLEPLPVVFARYVVASSAEDEAQFLREMRTALQTLNIPRCRLLPGRAHVLRRLAGPLQTRSLMVADLSPEASLRLQRVGLGPDRVMGCGLFLGHKDIAPVRSQDA
jgi:CRISPR-associated protein Cas6